MLNTFCRGIFILYQQIDQKKGGDISKFIGNEQTTNDMEQKHLQKQCKASQETRLKSIYPSNWAQKGHGAWTGCIRKGRKKMTKIRKIMQKCFTSTREKLWQVLGKDCMYKGRNNQIKVRLNDRLMKGMLSEVTDSGESWEISRKTKCQKDNPRQLWGSRGKMDTPVSHHWGVSKWSYVKDMLKSA